MNVLVTGIKGQLGYDVSKECIKRNHNVISADIDEMDLANEIQIKEFIYSKNPDAIIHCGAYTQVDLAEDNETLCRNINALSVAHIAHCCKDLDIPLIFMSTDYVFDGLKDGEYVEEDTTNPLSIYGKTKLEGENYIREILQKYYIVRTSWVFGINGHNFIKTILNLCKKNNTLNIINDQIGSPTYTKDLAILILDMLDSDKYGTYHATNEGFCSWYEFATEITNLSNIDININPISSHEYKSKAIRPLNSKLSKNKLEQNGFTRLPSWQNALCDYLKYII